jgi:hypothetical protein
MKPFEKVITILQQERAKAKIANNNKKGSMFERIYKDIGNMLYGSVVGGISNKRKFDARTFSMKRMLPTNLTNPIIGG